VASAVSRAVTSPWSIGSTTAPDTTEKLLVFTRCRYALPLARADVANR
jgi:hypothetical protein